MDILLWLVPAAVATAVAMALAAWLGRDRSSGASSVTVPKRAPRTGPGEAVSAARPARADISDDAGTAPSAEKPPVEQPRRTA